MVPESFHFEQVFRTMGLAPAAREALKNAAYFVLHSLSRHKFSPYHLKKIEEKGFHRLSSKLLKSICGDQYKIVLDTLKEAGAVEEAPDGYQAGVRSRGFRLSRAMDMSVSVPRELAGGVRTRYQKHLVEQEKANHDSLASLAHLTKWFDSSDLTINVEQAHNFIELAHVKIQAMIANSSLPPDAKAEVAGRVALRLSYQIGSVNAFDKGEYRLSSRGRDERLHSVLTSMKRELRSFIQYQGQYLVSLDIRSSQPYLFTMLLRKSFFSSSVTNRLGWKSLVYESQAKRTGSRLPMAPTGPGATPPARLTAPTLMSTMFPGLENLTEKQVVDRARFLKVSWKSGIYGLLADELRASGVSVESTEAMKKLVMWLFFEHASYKYGDDRFKAFAALYPVEAGVIRGVNRLDAKLLPVILQRLESRIMLHQVTKAMSEKVPGAVLLAVHDCVLTTPDFAPEIEAVMKDELTRITGLAPGIKAEVKSAEDELDRLLSFTQSIFQDSVDAVQKSKTPLTYANYKLIPPLLEAEASYGKMSTRFNPFFYGRYEVPFNDGP